MTREGREGCELIDEVMHGVEGGIPTMASSGMAYIRPLTILAMTVPVVMIAVMFALIMRYKE